ncbi:MAG: YfaZ family outer membrane protein [Hydrogenovibrio sp.]|nr:YfaZ family outer membrane protein [Hydrogenovibrio sp.]
MTLKSIHKTLIALSLGVLSYQVQANDGHIGLDLSLSNDTANVGLYSLRETDRDLTNLGVDYFFNNPGDKFVDVFGSISRKGMADNENLELGIMGKIYYVDHYKEKQTGYGAMLGINGRYWLPTEMPMSLYADALYSPSITSFNNVNSAYQADFKAEVRILPTAIAYLGYRKIGVDFDKGQRELDSNINIGVNIAIQ